MKKQKLKKFLVSYFNTDIKKQTLAMFSEDDFRLKNAGYKIIGELIKVSKNKVFAPNKHKADVYCCILTQQSFYIFSDWSALQF